MSVSNVVGKQKGKANKGIIVAIAVAIILAVSGLGWYLLKGGLPSVEQAEKDFKKAGYTVESMEKDANGFVKGFSAKSYAAYVIYGEVSKPDDLKDMEKYTKAALSKLFNDADKVKVKSAKDLRGVTQMQTNIGSVLDVNVFSSGKTAMIVVGSPSAKDDALVALNLKGKKESKAK